jgi:hypothetical protein
MGVSQSDKKFGPSAFLLLKVGDGSYLVCQSIVSIDSLEGEVQASVEELFRTKGAPYDVCEIPPPTDDDRGVMYLQAKIQVGPGR